MSINLRLSSSASGTRNVNVTRNLVTDFSGVGDDTTNNATPLTSFNTFATAQSIPVVLNVPTGTYKLSSNGAQFFGKNILQYTMQGTGSSSSVIHLTSAASPIFVAGFGETGTSTTFNARIGSDVNAGATSLTLATPSEASRMPPGSKILVNGFAIQGTVGSPFGFPTNPHFFDYVTVVTADTGTGVVTFTPALTDSYKTTWPLISTGDASNLPQAGPAWVFVMDSSWNTTVQINDMGFTYDVGDVTTYSKGKSVTFNRCSWAGGSGKGPSPSENLDTTYANCDLTPTPIIEVDKIVTNLTFDTCTINKIQFQSSSIKNLTIRNCPSITAIYGLPRTAALTNNTVTELRFGPTSYGCAESAQINNNVVTTWIAGPGIEPILSRNLVMSGGVITTPRRVAVTGCADNGSGKVRLTVASTSALATGMSLTAQGLFVTGGQNIPYTLTVASATEVDITSLSFASVTWTGAGYLANQALLWAIPNRWINMTGTSGVYGNFKVLDVTEASETWSVQTNLAGGWPTGVTGIQTHPCSAYSGTGNTGSPEALEHSMSYAQNKPLFSYVNRTYDKTLATNNTIQPTIWGALSDTAAISVNVSTAYTGPTGTLTWRPTQFANQFRVLRSGSVTSLDLTINAKITGNRVYNGATQTWSGAQSGDSLPTLLAGDRLIGTHVSAPCLSANVSADNAGPVIVYEVKADQGI